MEKALNITLWDLDTNRIADINRNLHTALKKSGLKGTITIMSEPPLISRMNLTHRIPVLEIDGEYWTLRAGEGISEKDCMRLFSLLAQRVSEV